MALRQLGYSKYIEELEEASTQKNAKNHAGDVFCCWLRLFVP